MKFFLENRSRRRSFFETQSIVSILFFFVFLHCNTDREDFRKAYALEESGEKIQAIYYYEVILRRNPRFYPAHKRMGFLLSESPQSHGVATFHLEKAWSGNNEDLETGIKLFFNYMIANRPEFARGIQEEIRSRRRENLNEFLEWILRCDASPKPIPLKPEVFSQLEEWEKKTLFPLIERCEKKAPTP